MEEIDWVKKDQEFAEIQKNSEERRQKRLEFIKSIGCPKCHSLNKTYLGIESRQGILDFTEDFLCNNCENIFKGSQNIKKVTLFLKETPDLSLSNSTYYLEKNMIYYGYWIDDKFLQLNSMDNIHNAFTDIFKNNTQYNNASAKLLGFQLAIDFKADLRDNQGNLLKQDAEFSLIDGSSLLHNFSIFQIKEKFNEKLTIKTFLI